MSALGGLTILGQNLKSFKILPWNNYLFKVGYA